MSSLDYPRWIDPIEYAWVSLNRTPMPEVLAADTAKGVGRVAGTRFPLDMHGEVRDASGILARPCASQPRHSVGALSFLEIP